MYDPSQLSVATHRALVVGLVVTLADIELAVFVGVGAVLGAAAGAVVVLKAVAAVDSSDEWHVIITVGRSGGQDGGD